MSDPMHMIALIGRHACRQAHLGEIFLFMKLFRPPMFSWIVSQRSVGNNRQAPRNTGITAPENVHLLKLRIPGSGIHTVEDGSMELGRCNHELILFIRHHPWLPDLEK